MRAVPLESIVRYTDRLLQVPGFPDWDRALNGLQAANSGRVHRIAACVDASLATARLAALAQADLLVVHHGLFWNATTPWTGPRLELMRTLLDADLAVYGVHLPLDAHPRLGNNVLLAAALGLGRTRPFFETKGRRIGRRARTLIPRAELVRRLEEATGRRPVVVPGGPEKCREVGVVTGGAGAELEQAALEGVDTLITGEGPHWTFARAEELGLNVLYGGHYATETFGVRALAEHLGAKFRLPWAFLDYPTGL